MPLNQKTMHKKILISVISLALCSAVSAQQMYRCGSTYQDRPCTGKDSKVIAGISSTATQQSASKSDPACTRLGADAQKIKWAREGGRTEELALAAARNASEKQLVADVYARSGTSGEVRAGVEADCMAEKEKDTAAVRWQSKDKRGTPVASASNEAASNHDASTPASAKNNADSSKKAACEQIKSAMDSVRKNQRGGGDSATMEDLRQQLRDTDKAARDAGC